MNIDQAINLEDIRRLAKRKLPRIAFDFIDGGVDAEQGLLRNREAFSDYNLIPRYLRDVSKRDQSVTLFGQTYSSPIGISPMGLASMFRPGGDTMMAQAAAQRNVPFLMSGSSNESIESAAKIAPDQVWFQVYCTRDEKINQHLVGRAAEAGVRTLVLTVDVIVNANRERNRRNGFTRPFRFTPSIVLQALSHPAWLLQYLRAGGIPMMQNWQPYARPGASADEVADLFGSVTPSPASTWKTVESVRRWWRGPLLIKGLMHPDDAREAVALGADGLIVSNHGARQLDAAPAPLHMLPLIRAAVPGIPLLMDSGIRRGSDVVIALCLGAQGALMGRPMMFGVAAAGARGAAKALEIIHTEVDKVMAQIGCTRLAELGPGHIRRDGPERLT